jgi:hypothetical protein
MRFLWIFQIKCVFTRTIRMYDLPRKYMNKKFQNKQELKLPVNFIQINIYKYCCFFVMRFMWMCVCKPIGKKCQQDHIAH